MLLGEFVQLGEVRNEEELGKHQKWELDTLLKAFSRVFQEPTSLPPQRETDHAIVLREGAGQVRVRSYRYAHGQKEEIEHMVKEMLWVGIIQPNTSSYSSPVILVKKKDGSWRFCVDYRELNKITVPYKFPILIIEELLDEIHGAQ